jgi:hypothetical protein
MPLARLVELVVPGSFGDPEFAVAAVAGDAPWAPSLYVGAPLLALAAVRTPARRMLGLVIGLSGLALIVGRGGWPSWLGAPELHVAALALVAFVAGTGFAGFAAALTLDAAQTAVAARRLKRGADGGVAPLAIASETLTSVLGHAAAPAAHALVLATAGTALAIAPFLI